MYHVKNLNDHMKNLHLLQNCQYQVTPVIQESNLKQLKHTKGMPTSPENRTGRVVWPGLRELRCGQEWLILSLLPFLFSLSWHGLMALHAYIIMASWQERKVFSLQSPFRKVLQRILISLPGLGTSHCSQICEVLWLATPIPPSEKAMAPHSSTLAWKIPRTEEPGRLQSIGLWRVRHDWATSLSLSTFLHWRRKWQPTLVFLPGKSHGRRSLVGCCLWGCTESDTTEAT